MGTMKFRPIVVDNTQQELTEHGTAEFPMSMDEQILGREGSTLIPHWHYEIQIGVVTRGSVKFRTPAGEYLLQTGQGIFINQGVLHEAVETGVPDSAYICVNFKPEMIYGQPSNTIRRDYVDPIIFNSGLQSIPLLDEPWQREICSLMLELGRVNNAQEYGYELELKILLCRIWHILLVNRREELEKMNVVSFSDKQRMQAIRLFIQKNYMEKLSLSEIARAAHISRSECCRVFRRVEQITPMLYLTRYRIAQSVKLLGCTDLSISQIAQHTGFSSSSYYTECFKKEMNCTPVEYRRQALCRPRPER